MNREGTNVSRNRGFKEQLSFRNVRKTRWVYRKIIGMKTVKQVVRTSSGLRRIRKFALAKHATIFSTKDGNQNCHTGNDEYT
jgi:hypothetical protein